MRLFAFALGLLFLAGCSEPGLPLETPTPTKEAPLPARTIVPETSANTGCTEVLMGTQDVPFTVEAGYAKIALQFHAVGVGQVGWELTGPNGSIANEPDKNPATACGGHGTHPPALIFAVNPGSHKVHVRHFGSVSWMLSVDELPPEAEPDHGGHHAS